MNVNNEIKNDFFLEILEKISQEDEGSTRYLLVIDCFIWRSRQETQVCPQEWWGDLSALVTLSVCGEREREGCD